MARSQKRKIQQSLSPDNYLEMPYSRVIVPEQDGTFRAEILEFPGCIATGDTEAEALASLKGVALSWLEAMLARGQVIPEPMENKVFSGKLVLRLPKSLHKKAARAAERDGVSLNQLIVNSLAEHVSTISVASSVTSTAHVYLVPPMTVNSFVRGGAPRQILTGQSPAISEGFLELQTPRTGLLGPAHA